MHDSLGSVTEPKNNSKGCGGVMRVAPIGLYFDEKQYSPEQIDMIGAQAAALTHGHELGYIPAAMLVHIIHILSHSETSTVIDAVIDAKTAISRLFPHAVHLADLVKLIDKAITLASDKSVKDIDAVGELGQGWVAEETLAIAVYCALKYENSFEKAIIAAVNHSGDSDSTGSVTGNILGAHLGLSSIPKKFLKSLELKDTILEIADDLFKCGNTSERENLRNDIWKKKYIYHTYPDK